MDKFIELINSRRFQQLTIGAVLLILSYYGIVPQDLANILASYLGISITVGTLDKFSQS